MMEQCYRARFDFKDEDYLKVLQWSRVPDTEQSSSDGLQVHMSKDSDFWQKTYYDPPLLNDNGHLLYKTISDKYILMETVFELEAQKQYDQAGLMVRLDTDHWFKAGLEYVDGKYRLGVVVTNEYSDWSVQPYPSGKLGLRVYRQGNDFVVEAKSPDSDTWDFIRICHLHIEKDAPLKMGLLACSPTDAGGKVLFNHLSYSENKGYHH